ncbi:MAG: energy-coupling factor transporter ATPase [Clostridia bacterium]|nr:energy-coupling factor transporter ATPase [Clostridia bacterium]
MAETTGEKKHAAEIELSHVTYRYSVGTPFEKAALQDVSLKFEAGIITGLMGHTGSGKSTIAQLLNGILRPTEGQVLIDGRDIWAEPKKIREICFRVGLVFQYPEYQLFEETVAKDIAYGPHNMGLDEKEIARRVEEAARFTGLTPDLFEKSPFELSGGQKRRVAIAGVMAMDPEILVLDEPAAGLDPRGRKEILGGIRAYQREKGNTIIIISHSMEDMAVYADKLMVLDHGHLSRYGTSHEVFCHAEELKAVGLSRPQITKLMMELQKAGIPVDSGIYTVDDAYEAVVRLFREKKQGGMA